MTDHIEGTPLQQERFDHTMRHISEDQAFEDALIDRERETLEGVMYDIADWIGDKRLLYTRAQAMDLLDTVLDKYKALDELKGIGSMATLLTADGTVEEEY